MTKVLPITLLFGCSLLSACQASTKKADGERSETDYERTDPRIHSLNEFRLNDALVASQLIADVGYPARYVGSDVTWFVYRLEDGNELWLLFKIVPHEGFLNLTAAQIRGSGGNTISRVFDSRGQS